MNKKFTSTIAGASIFISLLGLLSRGFGFIREVVFANNFGLAAEFDLYLVGAVLPITINTVILYIGQNYLVPSFQKLISEKPGATEKYYNQSFLFFIVIGLLIALILFLISEFLINLYIHPATQDTKQSATLIFRILILTIPFSAGISMISALLQTAYEFKYPPISVLYLNLSIIVMIFTFTDKIGIYAIPLGYLVGTILQFFYLLFKSRRYFKPNLFLNLYELRFLRSTVGSSFLIILLIEFVGQLYSLFDRYFYGAIYSGGIASLNYAYIIFLLPISIFSLSLATVVFPKITQAIVNSSKHDFERIYNDSISVNILIFMPITFILFYFGDTIIKLAFERGKFFAESTSITYNALKLYSISLVFYSVYSVLNKIFYSIGLTKVLLGITIGGILIKLALNFMLVQSLHQYGLAISTSASYIFFFSISYIVINRNLTVRNKTVFFKDFLILIFNGFFTYIIIEIFINIFSIRNTIIDVALIMVFMIFYFLNLLLLKHRPVELLIQVFNRLKSNKMAKEYQ
jgi:putative peptidoglycan lipid II flippase